MIRKYLAGECEYPIRLPLAWLGAELNSEEPVSIPAGVCQILQPVEARCFLVNIVLIDRNRLWRNCRCTNSQPYIFWLGRLRTLEISIWEVVIRQNPGYFRSCRPIYTTEKCIGRVYPKLGIFTKATIAYRLTGS